MKDKVKPKADPRDSLHKQNLRRNLDFAKSSAKTNFGLPLV